jgi:hypothetical protein
MNALFNNILIIYSSHICYVLAWVRYGAVAEKMPLDMTLEHVNE